MNLIEAEEHYAKLVPGSRVTRWTVRAGGDYPELGQRSHDVPGQEVVAIDRKNGWAVWCEPEKWLGAAVR